MNVMLCRPHRPYLGVIASTSSIHTPNSKDSEKFHKSHSAKPSLLASSPSVLSNSTEGEPKGESNRSDVSTSFNKSLPLPLPIRLSLPKIPSRDKLPSPLKFLWFYDQSKLEEVVVKEENEKRNGNPLSLSSAPRLGEVDTNEGLESFAEDTRSQELKEETTFNISDRLKSWVPSIVNLVYLRKYGFDFPKIGDEEVDDHVRVPGLHPECGCEVCGGDHYLQSEPKLKKSVIGFEIPVVHDKGSFGEFLQRMEYSDLKFFSKMSNLCNQAYYIPEIKKEELAKLYGLQFITSSLERKTTSGKEKTSFEDKEMEKAFDSSEDHLPTSSSKVKTEIGKLNPAKSTYAMAAAAASYLASQTKSFLPFKKSDSEQAVLEEDDELDDVAEDFYTFSEWEEYIEESAEKAAKLSTDKEVLSAETSKIGTSEARALKDSCNMKPESLEDELSPVAAAATATKLLTSEEETKDAVAEVLQSDAFCPSEWFVCDEEETSTRYFVIQGSDSLASWQANLIFESCTFEDPEWGVMVHRGMYEAAKGLYEQLTPLIQAHMVKHGNDAKFYFTGHSLGGSLSTLLTLMLRHRGVLPLSAILPVYTFGTCGVMCGGDWLLEHLGFPLSHVQSVVMHYDLVPRAFACHYPDQVIEVLKRLNGTFRKQPCLQQQKLMYAWMGKMYIVQPDQQQAPHHPLLPPGGALYAVRHPKHDIYEDTIKDPHSQAMRYAKEVRSAERSFLNSPHPLEILSDPASYGSEGTISRDHDAGQYLLAINTALREAFKRWRQQDKDKGRLWSTPIKIKKPGKRLFRSFSSERNKLRRSASFVELEAHTIRGDVASDSQTEPISR
ncbi:phospholipase A1 PLIP3, chloroplastic [Physcomitrium patens]|uniref:Fungal lipase-type domain-containing protein n=1 Tax=Physcomitrium patens TaxID=3218 RepID=A0A2K1KKU3_PHYPA|nr:uncharacterized protein LOC112282394 [Physcomitrium patens]PNR54401.1 hypothetical protein PHYPA_008078 [Physcomitrium patens]|eukprot:XP_024375693.1 uncharacterized protein LOC112282394 [Physcomitrella patens]